MQTNLLLVDDNVELLQTATLYMNQLRPKWRILLAHSLEEARHIYNKYFPDAAVLDVNLPDGNGLDLLSEFKQKRPDLPVIVISGKAPKDLGKDVTERGGYSFLPKPFSVLALVDQIEAAISVLVNK